MGPGGDMMFGITIQGVNLSAVPRLFDITLMQEFYTGGYTFKNSSSIPLEPRSKDHLNFNEQVVKITNTYSVDNSLCPKIGQQLVLTGKITSDLFSRLRIKVKRCNIAIDSTCANDTIFGAYEAALGKY